MLPGEAKAEAKNKVTLALPFLALASASAFLAKIYNGSTITSRFLEMGMPVPAVSLPIS